MSSSFYRGSIRAIEPLLHFTGDFTLRVEIKNLSDELWVSAGPNPIYVAYHWLDEAWNMVVFDGQRTPLPEGGIAPGECQTVLAQVQAPKNSGTYRLMLTLVREGVSWFDSKDPFSSQILRLDAPQKTLCSNSDIRVLFFLEPVVYNEPGFLSCHLFWAEMFARAVESCGGHFALAANAEVISSWKTQYSHFGETRTFSLDSKSPLAPFCGDRRKYSISLYANPTFDNPLIKQLEVLRKDYDPSLVVYTSQNSYAAAAFDGIPCLNIERSPLPRLGHPDRTMFDPLGHQVGSILERHAEEIRRLSLSQSQKQTCVTILQELKSKMRSFLPEGDAILSYFNDLRSSHKIALLVTQPPEWVTYEGAFDSTPLYELIANWAENLSAGWVGIPTYHAGYRLEKAQESLIAQNFPNIRLLPLEWAQAKTEALLPYVDGIVTLSSTTAMSAVLLQKKVAVTGLSPFQSWATREANDLESAPVLTNCEVASTLAFLTSEFSWRDNDLKQKPFIIAEIISKTMQGEFLSEKTIWTETPQKHRINLFSIN